ncbi:MAG: S8 family serine peptidase, partial [Actinobacteria bacterium]|nr:S8 family serine peptidase [Actinomycetota bacterium]
FDAAVDDNAVINISGTLGETPRPAEQDAMRWASSLGKIVVAAAGNDGLLVPEYPASYSDVVSVGAIKPDGTREEFSNWGPWVDIFAPGDNVITTDIVPNGSSTQQTYNYHSGTSLAAAIVSGAAAFMKGLATNPSSSAVMNAIAATAQGDVTTNHPLYLDMRLAVRQLLAHAWNTQLDLTPGRFFAIKSGGGVTAYLVDDGSIRPVVSSQALESWGERPERLYAVVAAPYGRADARGGVGFRPGSLISPKITGGLDAPGDQILVVTNDPQPTNSSVSGRWVQGQASDVTVSLACLGYKIDRVVAVDPTVAAIHGTPSVWPTCNFHPNGTILRRTPAPPPEIQGNTRYDHRAWMLDRGFLRLVAGTDWSLYSNDPYPYDWGNPVVWDSWGIGDYYWGIDPTRADRNHVGESDAVIPTSSTDAEILSKMTLAEVGSKLGMRPGSVFRYGSTASSAGPQDDYWVVTSDGADFGLGPKRYIGNSPSCFHAGPSPTVTQDIFVIHSRIEDWKC